MSGSKSRRIAITVMALFSMACGRMHRGAPDGETIVVDATNENYYDARIHAVYVGGPRRSLGTVAANGGRARVRIAWEPRALVFEVQLITEGSTYVSHSVDVAPGDTFDFLVPQNISQSGFFRRLSR